jgi:hypothetical protein
MAVKKVNKTYEVKSKYSEKQILASKTPEEYIDRTLNSDISRGRKTVMCRLWREQTGYTIEDVQFARNRHPYWKQKKMNGWQERNERRWAEHDYKTKPIRGQQFSAEKISHFLDLNKKDKAGKYQMRDWEIAKELQVTIPAVQHWRRKHLIVLRIFEAEEKKVTKKVLLDYLTGHENGLRKKLKELKRSNARKSS